MFLAQGRPADADLRLEKERKVYDLLDQNALPYQRVDHEPAMTMEICAEITQILGAEICKNLFLCNRQQTDFYLLMMPADKPFKTKDLSAQIGSSRLSFATAEHMERYLDLTPGSVSVLGLMNDAENAVQLIIDRDVLEQPFVGCHPCINTSSLKIATKDLINVLLPAMKHDYRIVDLNYTESV